MKLLRCPAKIDLSAFSDGELSERVTKEVEGHLAHCPSCADEVKSLTQLKQTIQTLTFEEYHGQVSLPTKVTGSGFGWKQALAICTVVVFLLGTSLYYEFFDSRTQLASVEELLVEHALGEQLHVSSYGLFGN